MPALLAIDLGLRTGLALYRGDGRLAWYRSQHFGTRDALRRGVRGLLAVDPPTHLLIEGGGPLAEIWLREAARRGLDAHQVAAEDWRADLFRPAEHAGRRLAKRSADELARRVIDRSGAPRPTSLRHDAAEAILIGLWGAWRLGWLKGLAEALDA